MLTLHTLILPKTKKTMQVDRTMKYVIVHSDSLKFIFANSHGMKVKMTGKIYKDAFGEDALKIALDMVSTTLNDKSGLKMKNLISYK